jgi:hypothetical protein
MKNLSKVVAAIICILFFSISQSQAQTSSFATKKNPARFEAQLGQLNTFLEGFSDGYYGTMEVEGDFVIIRFPEGKYSKFKVEDLYDPVLEARFGQIYWDCIDGSLCVETDWNDEGSETGILFSDYGSDGLEELLSLLNDFIRAYRGM